MFILPILFYRALVIVLYELKSLKKIFSFLEYYIVFF